MGCSCMEEVLLKKGLLVEEKLRGVGGNWWCHRYVVSGVREEYGGSPVCVGGGEMI